ncbi:hypothetical protein A2U01_0035730, partial [Trifolium medium]|nr:hypothetical protein [Trifolium medium]
VHRPNTYSVQTVQRQKPACGWYKYNENAGFQHELGNRSAGGVFETTWGGLSWLIAVGFMLNAL